MDDLEVLAASPTGETIILSADKITLRPGPNMVTLSCRVSFEHLTRYARDGKGADQQTLVQGLFVVERATIRLGQVNIEYADSLAGVQLRMWRPSGSLSATVRMPYNSKSPFFHGVMKRSLTRDSRPGPRANSRHTAAVKRGRDERRLCPIAVCRSCSPLRHGRCYERTW